MYRIKHKISSGNWQRVINFDFECQDFFTITTDKFIIRITGGSIIISDKINDAPISRIKGYNYLYTGDVTPDEKDLFALENGKHFYIVSLEDFKQKLKVTLPRSFESIDTYGSYSKDGKHLYIPVQKYVDKQRKYWLCEYETTRYSLVSMEEISKSNVTFWYS